MLVVVVGAPGSGKTTLADQLAKQLRLPVLHRDDFWISLLRPWTHEPTPPSGAQTTEAFVAAATALLKNHVSCIADDNFSVRDSGFLAGLSVISRCIVIRVSSESSPERFADRLRRDPVANHPKILTAMKAASVEDVINAQHDVVRALIARSANYVTGLPTLDVDTSVHPDLEAIQGFIEANYG